MNRELELNYYVIVSHLVHLLLRDGRIETIEKLLPIVLVNQWLRCLIACRRGIFQPCVLHAAKTHQAPRPPYEGQRATFDFEGQTFSGQIFLPTGNIANWWRPSDMDRLHLALPLCFHPNPRHPAIEWPPVEEWHRFLPRRWEEVFASTRTSPPPLLGLVTECPTTVAASVPYTSPAVNTLPIIPPRMDTDLSTLTPAFAMRPLPVTVIDPRPSQPALMIQGQIVTRGLTQHSPQPQPRQMTRILTPTDDSSSDASERLQLIRDQHTAEMCRQRQEPFYESALSNQEDSPPVKLASTSVEPMETAPDQDDTVNQSTQCLETNGHLEEDMGEDAVVEVTTEPPASPSNSTDSSSSSSSGTSNASSEPGGKTSGNTSQSEHGSEASNENHDQEENRPTEPEKPEIPLSVAQGAIEKGTSLLQRLRSYRPSLNEELQREMARQSHVLRKHLTAQIRPVGIATQTVNANQSDSVIRHTPRRTSGSPNLEEVRKVLEEAEIGDRRRPCDELRNIIAKQRRLIQAFIRRPSHRPYSPLPVPNGNGNGEDSMD